MRKVDWLLLILSFLLVMFALSLGVKEVNTLPVVEDKMSYEDAILGDDGFDNKGMVVVYAQELTGVDGPLMELSKDMTASQIVDITQHNFEILDRRTR